MTRALAVAFILALGAAGTVDAKPLRVAAPGPSTGPCAAPGGSAPAGERAYYAHLSKRLGVEVQKCPVVGMAGAAAALAAGAADMAVLDPVAYPTAQSAARAILTLRANGGVNRIPVVLAVRAADPRQSLTDLKGAAVAFGGRSPAALGVPKAMLADRGAGPGFFGREVIDPDEETAIGRLRGRQVDAIALHAAAWQRLCRPVSPKAAAPCGDLRVVLRARPRAAGAVVVRRDMDAETRFRLIGIHMPLHLEAPAAFAWAAAWTPGAAEFTPAEAEALTLAKLP